jgi:hypothetical protein
MWERTVCREFMPEHKQPYAVTMVLIQEVRLTGDISAAGDHVVFAEHSIISDCAAGGPGRLLRRALCQSRNCNGSIYFTLRQEERARLFIVVSTLGCIIGTLFIVWKMTLFTVVMFMIIYSISAPLQGNTITSFYFRLIGILPLKGLMRVESVVMRETFVNSGRVIAIFVLIMLVRYSGEGIIPWVLLIASIMQIGLFWMLAPERQNALEE